jgi:hypothetical protein
MTWCFDTSALIEPWVRLYPPDVFAAVWEELLRLADAGDIVAPRDVLLELGRQKDDLHDWAVNHAAAMFTEADRATIECVADIVNDHPDFMKVDSTKSGADPFVVGMAEAHGLTIVTYENMAKKDAAPRIPNVCQTRGLKWVQLVDVLRSSGFKL